MCAATNTSIAQAYGRRFIFNVFYGFLAQGFRFAISMFLVAYVLRKLGVEQWGLVVLAESTVAFLALINLGASAGVSKKLNSFLIESNSDAFVSYFGTSVVLCSVAAFVILAVVALLLTVFWQSFGVAEELAWEGKAVLIAIGTASVCATLSLPAKACLQAAHRLDIDSKLEMVSIFLRASMIIVLFEFTTPRASLYALVLVVVRAAAMMGSWVWVWSHIPTARIRMASINMKVISDVVRFNVLVLFNSLNYVFFMQAPTILLVRFGGLGIAGLYGISLNLNNFVRAFLQVGVSSLQPVTISLAASHNISQLTSVFCISTKVFASSALMIWVGFLFLGKPFLSIWLGPNIAHRLDPAILWLVGVSAVGVATMPAAVFLVALERLRLSAFGGLGLTLAMIVSIVYLGISSKGDLLVQTSIALFLFFSSYQIIRFCVVARALRLRIKYLVFDLVLRSAIPVGLVCLFLVGVCSLGEVKTVLRFCLFVSGALLVFLIGVALTIFTRDERLIVANVLRNSKREKA